MAIGKLYGATGGEVVVRPNTDGGDPTVDFGPWPSGTTFTAWTTMAGTTPITELYDLGHNLISVVTTTAPLYRTMFYGPSTITGAIWLKDPDGNMWLFNPSDLASRIGGVTSVSLNDSAPAGGDVKLYFNPDPLDLDIPPFMQQLLALTNLADVQAYLGITAGSGGTGGGGGGGGGGSTNYGQVDPADPTNFIPTAALGAVDPNDPTDFIVATGVGQIDPTDPTNFII